MNLLPFRLYLKIRRDQEKSQKLLADHQSAIDKICTPIGSIAFAHLNSSSKDKDKAQDGGRPADEYGRSLALVVGHMKVDTKELREELLGRLSDAIRFLRAADNSFAPPTPFEVAIAAGHDVFTPGGPGIWAVIGRDLRKHNTIESLPQTLDAIKTTADQAEPYLAWLENGMPDWEPPRGFPDKDTTHPMKKSPYHFYVYQNITVADMLLFHDAKVLDTSNVKTVERLKVIVMAEYCAYLRHAGTLLENRINLLNRYLEGKKRR